MTIKRLLIRLLSSLWRHMPEAETPLDAVLTGQTITRASLQVDNDPVGYEWLDLYLSDGRRISLLGLGHSFCWRDTTPTWEKDETATHDYPNPNTPSP